MQGSELAGALELAGTLELSGVVVGTWLSEDSTELEAGGSGVSVEQGVSELCAVLVVEVESHGSEEAGTSGSSGMTGTDGLGSHSKLVLVGGAGGCHSIVVSWQFGSTGKVVYMVVVTTSVTRCVLAMTELQASAATSGKTPAKRINECMLRWNSILIFDMMDQREWCDRYAL